MGYAYPADTDATEVVEYSVDVPASGFYRTLHPNTERIPNTDEEHSSARRGISHYVNEFVSAYP
jgi:hypothetical protein